MRILIDMNLSPAWVDYLNSLGHEAVHWSTLGPGDAADTVLLEYAANGNFVVFTHDLDHGAILAATKTVSPSVIQIRSQAPTPAAMGPAVGAALVQFEEQLMLGALITVDLYRARAHLLPVGNG